MNFALPCYKVDLAEISSDEKNLGLFAKHINFGEIRTIMCDQCAELGGLVQYLASL